jgi:hypothetical protein
VDSKPEFFLALELIFGGPENAGAAQTVLWQVDPLLGNDREITNIQQPFLSNGSAIMLPRQLHKTIRVTVFSTRSVPRCYRQDKSRVG